MKKLHALHSFAAQSTWPADHPEPVALGINVLVPHVCTALPAVKGVDEFVELCHFSPGVVGATTSFRPMTDTLDPPHPLAHALNRELAFGGRPDCPVVDVLLLFHPAGPWHDPFLGISGRCWAAASLPPRHEITSSFHPARPPPAICPADSAQFLLEAVHVLSHHVSRVVSRLRPSFALVTVIGMHELVELHDPCSAVVRAPANFAPGIDSLDSSDSEPHPPQRPLAFVRFAYQSRLLATAAETKLLPVGPGEHKGQERQ